MFVVWRSRASWLFLAGMLALSGVFGWSAFSQDEAANQTAAQLAGLKRFQYLVGAWRASSQPVGTQRKGTVETVRWAWHLKRDAEPAMKLSIGDGTFFESALLRYDAEGDEYRLVAERILDEEEAKAAKAKTETVIFEGKIQPSENDPTVQVLDLQRRLRGTKIEERVTLRLQDQHHYVFQLDRRTGGKNYPFRPMRIYSVTREGESIATLVEAKEGPVCIVSGGLGTSSLVHNGVTYYFCCSGCLESFRDDPEKWIAAAKNLPKAK